MGSRFHAVRAFDVASGLGPPRILDYGTAHARPRLLPHPGRALERSRTRGTVYAEWLRMPAGVWVPAIAGGAGSGEMQLPMVAWPGDWGAGDSGGIINHALDSAYVFNSANDALAARTSLSTAKTLAAIYVFVAAATGAPTGLNLEIVRNNTATTPVTGATSVATTTAVPSLTANRWNKVTWSVANIGGHVSDRFFWFVIADANGTAGARWSIARYITTTTPTSNAIRLHKSLFTTTGWTTLTDDLQVSMIVLVFSDGTARGWPFANTSVGTSNANQKGLRVATGFTAPTRIFGYRYSSSAGTPSVAYIWEGGTGGVGPTGPGNLLAGVTTQFVEGGTNAVTVFPPTALLAATPYRFTIGAGGGSFTARRFTQGTLASGTAAELSAAALFGGAAHWTEESAGAWTNVTTDLTQWALLLEDQMLSAGGGLRVAGRGGLAVGA